MSSAPQPAGTREQNKQQKLVRITAAARELFAEYGVDDVTTQQIAESRMSVPDGVPVRQDEGRVAPTCAGP